MTDLTSIKQAIAAGANRIQGMVRSIDQYRNGDPKAIMAGSHAQAIYALTDARHDLLVLWDFAVAAGFENAALKAERDRLREALERLVKTYADMEDGDGEPCQDVKFAKAALTDQQKG